MAPDLPPSSKPVPRLPADPWRNGTLAMMAFGVVSGLVGVYWDISWHIDIGRDSFFTLPHNFIYAAIALTLIASVYGLWRDRRASPLHLRVAGRTLHPGILVAAFGAAVELLFAPADDLWHRLFGADVTLWAPMHLIGLLGLTLLAFGGLVTAEVERRLGGGRRYRWASVFFAAGLLGWGVLHTAEYEFGEAAFPMLWHPLLLAAVPALVLVLVARLRPLPFAATLTALLFTALRLLIAALLVGTAALDLAGHSRPFIPLLLLAGLTADGLRDRAPLWLQGLATGAAALVATAPLALAGGLAWHPQALWLGGGVGLALAAALAYPAAWAAAALAGGDASARSPAGGPSGERPAGAPGAAR